MLCYHENLFMALMEKKVLKDGNARAMAWQYTSPIITILSMCDREPEKEAEFMMEIDKHIIPFFEEYKF